MKFFRKTSVAVLLTALVVVLCCVWGYTRAYTSVQQQEETPEPAGGGEQLKLFPAAVSGRCQALRPGHHRHPGPQRPGAEQHLRHHAGPAHGQLPQRPGHRDLRQGLLCRAKAGPDGHASGHRGEQPRLVPGLRPRPALLTPTGTKPWRPWCGRIWTTPFSTVRATRAS